MIDTSDLTLDSGETPVTTKFRLAFGSPTLADANKQTYLDIEVTWKHPCRYDVIVPSMFDADDSFSVILEQPSLLAFPDWEHLVSCGEGPPQYTVEVT